ncbi:MULTISPECIES: DUF1269 domain-containing protein [unclassified Nocardioides]|uniref:DUF1269 domain-containing protein n=1 Tax=Nocardioides sp. URHA0032 TaxID=1380388 RepID=UPI00048F5691|nr:DUF1269 domain-containing protein [Nocardioides sp. URHA0032]
MPSLTVWRYPTPLGVDAGELLLRRLEEQDALTVHDAVAVFWMPGAEQPVVRRVRHRAAGAAGKGTFWGALVGTLVLAPVAGAAVGATAATVVSRLRHAGVPAETVDALRGALEPGTSALFVVSSDARPEVVGPALAAGEGTLIHAEMDDETAEELRRLLEP